MNNCIEKAIAFYHIAGAAIGGTQVMVPDPETLGNVWKTLTVINDTDQDIKVTFKTAQGYDNAFIVPVSIKGFTKALKSSLIDNTTVYVYSMNGSSAAVGNITFNFGV